MGLRSSSSNFCACYSLRPGVDVKRKGLFCILTSTFSQSSWFVLLWSGNPPLQARLLMHLDLTICTGMQPLSRKLFPSVQEHETVQSVSAGQTRDSMTEFCTVMFILFCIVMRWFVVNLLMTSKFPCDFL